MKQYNFRRKTVRTKIFFAGMMLCCGMATTAHAQVREGETITRTQTDTILVTDHKERVITNPFGATGLSRPMLVSMLSGATARLAILVTALRRSLMWVLVNG